jgi:hypothetical protein
MNVFTVEATPIKFNKYATKRHALLPARRFEKGGREINVTDDVLEAMARNFAARRPVTIAHPDLDGAEAHGWITSVDVSAFEDGKALYATIEWNDDAADAIAARKFGFLSPVFAMAYSDEAGNDIGPALLAAGLTNNPHWASDQPEVWQEFARSLDPEQDPGHSDPLDKLAKHEIGRVLLEATGHTTDHNAADAAQPQTTEEVDMHELEQAKARISELEASVAKLTAERDEAHSKLTQATAQVEAFTAAADDAEALREEVKQIKGDALMAQYADKLVDSDLHDAEGNPTPLKMAAYNDKDLFEFMVSLKRTTEPNTEPVGSDNDADVDAEERARRIAVDFCDANQSTNFVDVLARARAAVAAGKSSLEG